MPATKTVLIATPLHQKLKQLALTKGLTISETLEILLAKGLQNG